MILLFLFCLMVVPAHANTIHLTTGDTYLDSQNPLTNFGSQKKIRLKNTPTQDISGFLKFDFSSVPASFNIDNIYELNLKLWPDTITHAGAIEVFFIFSPWNEHRLISTNKPSPIITSGLVVPITMAHLNNHITIDLKLASNLLVGPNPATGIMLKPLNDLDMSFMAKEIHAGLEGARLSSAMEMKMIGHSADNAHSAVSALQTASTNLSGNIATNAGNISLNAGEISTNKNKNNSQDASISAIEIKHGEYEIIHANLDAEYRGSSDVHDKNETAIGINTSKNATQDIAITTNLNKNISQDTLLNSLDERDSVEILGIKIITQYYMNGGPNPIPFPALEITGNNLFPVHGGEEYPILGFAPFDEPRITIKGQHILKYFCEVNEGVQKVVASLYRVSQEAATVLVQISNTQGKAVQAFTFGSNGAAGADSTVAGPRGPKGDTGETGPIGIPQNAMIMWNGDVNAPPTGWSVCTGYANKFLVVAGSEYVSGAIGGRKTIAGHALSKAQMPSHNFTIPFADARNNAGSSTGSGHGLIDARYTTRTSSVGSGQKHSHGDNRPPYKAVVLLCKN